MGKGVSKVEDERAILELPPPVNEREAEWRRECEEYLAKLHSEMFTWLNSPRRSYRFNRDEG